MPIKSDYLCRAAFAFVQALGCCSVRRLHSLKRMPKDFNRDINSANPSYEACKHTRRSVHDFCTTALQREDYPVGMVTRPSLIMRPSCFYPANNIYAVSSLLEMASAASTRSTQQILWDSVFDLGVGEQMMRLPKHTGGIRIAVPDGMLRG